jgi:large subunit ribosomal protein L13
VSLFQRVSVFIRVFKGKIVDHNSYKTLHTNKATADKGWVVVDADGKVLGRVASQIAKIIRGKNKPGYSPNVDCGDHVVVINAEKVKMTGKKWNNRILFTYSGYPGGQRELTPSMIRAKHPTRLIEHAVRGMLPKNSIGRQLFRSLHVYTGTEHPHTAQQPKEVKF